MATASTSIADDNSLNAGAIVGGCLSALLVGPRTCDAAEDLATGPPGKAVGNRNQDLESRIDEYLANYGKPSRVAVRALLEPSDTNIQDLVRANQEKLAVAAYVAERMTELQGRYTSSAPRPLSDSSAFRQMRLTLYEHSRDLAATQAMQVLRDISLEEPTLQAGVAVVGKFAGSEMRSEIGRIDPPLAVSFVAPDWISADRLPFIRIEDLRNRRVLELDASELTSVDQLRRHIVALRDDARAHPSRAQAPLVEQRGQ